ncbi:MAG: DUF3368 domain-containing protein [Rubrivivax sp.]|nr:DUF3368 domain-containing protein [Rubrivivax sp.]
MANPKVPPPAAAIVVVSDAGPLISLARVDLLGVLPHLFAEVQVPDEVVSECLARPDNPDTERIRAALHAGLLKSCSAPPLVLAGLDAGECAAISRALQVGAAVLVDERAARAQASALGLLVTGTLGVLVRARRRGLIGPLAPVIQALRAGGQRLAQPVVDQALRDVGEALP